MRIDRRHRLWWIIALTTIYGLMIVAADAEMPEDVETWKRMYEECEEQLAKLSEALKECAKAKAAPPSVPKSMKELVLEERYLDRFDDSTKELHSSTVKEHYRWLTAQYQYGQDVYRWQLLSAKIIFVVVITLVLVGIYFSGIQFHSSLGRRGTKEKTEIEASTKGIKVSSPVLGVIILAISLLFFYLYLAYVYPIE